MTLIGEAVFARCLSALKDERVEAAKQLSGPSMVFEGDATAFIEDLQQALYASKLSPMLKVTSYCECQPLNMDGI